MIFMKSDPETLGKRQPLPLYVSVFNNLSTGYQLPEEEAENPVNIRDTLSSSGREHPLLQAKTRGKNGTCS